MKKPIIIRLIIIVVIIAGIGGVYLYMKHKNEVTEEKFWESQKPRIELFFRYNFEGIHSFHYTKTNKSPMGISIKGYVNGDPDLYFTADVAGYESEFNGLSSNSQKLGKLRKHSPTKSVDEILKEKENKE